MIRALLIALLLVVACSKNASDPTAPAEHVDELSWCYAAVVGGQETIGCAETRPPCETARKAAEAAAAEGEATSEECYQVQLRLDRANP